MSRKTREKRRQKKANSQAAKMKRAKKAYYNSPAARESWETKKARKEQSQENRRVSEGISGKCPLQGWEKPSPENCNGCKLKCAANATR